MSLTRSAWKTTFFNKSTRGRLIGLYEISLIAYFKAKFIFYARTLFATQLLQIDLKRQPNSTLFNNLITPNKFTKGLFADCELICMSRIQ